MTDARRLLERFAREERAVRDREFVAPVVSGGQVAVRVSGLVWRLTVAPHPRSGQAHGWSVLRATEDGRADVLRAAKLGEVSRYLERLPRFRFVLVERAVDRWLGVRATADGRLRGDVLYPVGLVTDGERFDTVCARFDGAAFWFESVDAGRDPGRGAWLRTQLAAGAAPELLQRPELTAEERTAYAHLVSARELAAQHAVERGLLAVERGLLAEVATEERRVRRAVEHAGGVFLRLDPVGEELTVTVEVDGHAHRALLRRRDLTVLSAGMCLSGQDSDFDLASLITVWRESLND